MMAAKISRDPSIPLAGNSAGSSPRRPADARHHPQISPTRLSFHLRTRHGFRAACTHPRVKIKAWQPHAHRLVPGSSAVLLPGSPVSSRVTYPEWDAIGAGAAATDLPPPVAALASLPDITEQSATRPAPCEADPTPTPCENTAGHATNIPPRSNRAPGP